MANTPAAIHTDICVIGGGAAGLSVASSAALLGVPVVLIERARMGGDCLNAGCVPSKALIAAANAAHSARISSALGVKLRGVSIDHAAVRRHIAGVIDEIAPMDSVARYRALGARVIEGEARFTGPRSLEVNAQRVTARRFVIAVGASPAIPPIPGLETVPYLTSHSIFKVDEIPKRLAIIGGGPIGLELAQAHRRLGSEVTVFEAGEILGREDVDARRLIRSVLEAEGVKLVEQADIAAICRREAGIVIELSGPGAGKPPVFTHLLVATGRHPNTEGLGLDIAGVALSKTGIQVDAQLRTSNPKIYAIGDCIAGPQFTHAASAQAGLVIRNALFRLPVRRKDALIPRVTFTDPEIAAAGLSETEARATLKGVRALRWPLQENDRARCDGRTAGFAKVLVDAGERIIGVTLVGPHAGEWLGLWQLAITRKLRIGAVIDLVLPYPTYSEAARRAALQSLTPKLRSPWLARVLRWLRLFG